jgi:DNA-directed RNA polymerase specialized sigma24 family protein
MSDRQRNIVQPETRWSLILRARDDSTRIRNQAIGELVQRYRPAMQRYLRRVRRLSEPVVDDLLQGFIADKIVERQLFSAADRGRGKFRTFLMASLDHYSISKHRHANAAKRSTGSDVSIVDAPEPIAPDNDPRVGFDLSWAEQTIEQALSQMREECILLQRLDIWGVFEDRVLGPTLHQREPLDYATIVTKYELTSPMQASNVLITGKRMFVRALRSVIADYAGNETEIDEELTDLRRALSEGYS